jgi:ATP-dependent protease ClpP protease subunit
MRKMFLVSFALLLFAVSPEKSFSTEPLEGCKNLFLTGQAGSEWLRSANTQAVCLDSHREEMITVTIQTDGGGVMPIVAMYQLFESLGIRNRVVTRALGVGSSGVIAFLVGGKREISCGSVLFMHPLRDYIDSGALRPSLRELQEHEGMLLIAINAYVDIVVANSALSREEVLKAVDGTVSMRVFSAEEAVRVGLAHTIVGCSKR